MFGVSDDRSQFLQGVQRSRDARRQEKKSEVAAVKIQTAARRFIANFRLRNRGRKEFDELFTGVQSYNAAAHPALEVFSCARCWLFMYRGEEDAKRLPHLCHAILASMEQAKSKVWYVSMIVKSDLLKPWLQQLKKILRLCCEHLLKLKPSNAKDSSVISMYLRMLITFTDCSGWKLTAKAGDAVRATLQQLCCEIQGDLIKNGLYASLQELLVSGLCRPEAALKTVSLTCVLTLYLRCLASSQYSPDQLASVLIHMLSVPGFVSYLQKIAPQSMVLLDQHTILSRSLELLAEPETIGSVCQRLQSVCTISLLGNLTQLFLTNDASSKLRVPFINVLTGMLESCHTTVTKKQSAASHWHALLGWVVESGADPRHAESMDLVSQQLQQLWKPSCLRLLFGDVILATPEGEPPETQASTTTPEHAKKKKKKGWSLWERLLNSRPLAPIMASVSQDSKKSQSLCNVCRLYYTCLTTFMQSRLDILTSLSCFVGLLPSLWHYLSSSGSLSAVLSASRTDSAIAKHAMLPVLALFSACCGHIVVLLDDIEVYEDQKPFSLAELVELSGFLNELCFNLIWNAASALKGTQASGTSSSYTPSVSASQAKSGIKQGLSSSTGQLLSATHTLLMLLYDRDCRRSYAPPNHWLIKSLPLSTFKSELDRRQQRAVTLLRMMPHCLPYLERVQIFRGFVSADKQRLGIVETAHSMPNSCYITIHRRRLLEDGYSQLSLLPAESMKGVVRVKFVNEQGLEEPGIDQDGVFKEFLEESIKLVFDPNFALFKSVSSGDKVFPSPNSSVHEQHLQMFEFVGRMLGKAVYEGIMIEVPFAYFFLTHVLGRTHNFAFSSFDELASLDLELYRSLTQLKHYDGDVEEELGLTFAVDEDRMGKLYTHDLKPGGRMINVTNTNRMSYIHLMANFKLCIQIKEQTKAFCHGFRSLIHPDWMVLFSPPELQRLVSGDHRELDVADLRKHVHYYGGFHSAHPAIRWLWDIVEKDFSAEEKGLFLKFVTSCSKPPVLGFAYLQPPFAVRFVDVTDEEDAGDTVGSVLRGFLSLNRGRRQSKDRLPTASTCFNLLKLPNYSKKSVMREKLRYAITSGAGFELS